jgi:hypothetical protein
VPAWTLENRFRPLRGASCDGLSLGDLEGDFTVLGADEDLAPGFERAVEEHAGEVVVHPALDGAPEGPGAELGVEALLGQERHRLVGELDLDVLGP